MVSENINQIINEENTELNKEQVEESQKKSIEKNPYIAKALKAKSDENEPKVYYRDYSGRIKYDNLSDGKVPISENDIVKPKDNAAVVKSDKIAADIKSTDMTTAFRHNEADVNQSIKGISQKAVPSDSKVAPKDNVVKGKTTFSDIVKEKRSTAIKDRKTAIKDSYTTYEKYAYPESKEQFSSTISDRQDKNSPYRYSQDKEEVNTEKPNGVIVDTKSLKIEVSEPKYSQLLSATAQEYVKQPATAQEKSKYMNITSVARRHTIKGISQLVIERNLPKGSYIDESCAATYISASDKYGDVVKSETSCISEKPENKTEIVNATEISSNSSLSISDIRTVKEGNRNFYRSKGFKTLSYRYANENSNSQRQDIVSTNNINTQTSVPYKAETNVLPESNNNSPRITKGNRRNKNIDKAKVEGNIKRYGIKSEVRNVLSRSVLQTDHRAKKVFQYGNYAIMKSIHRKTEEETENDLSIKAVDDAIKTTYSVGVIKNWISAISPKDIKSEKTAITSHNVRSSTDRLKNRIRKTQMWGRIRKKRNNKYSDSPAKSAVSAIAKIIGTAVKLAVIDLLSSTMGWIVMLIIIIGAVVAAIGSILWQTSSDLDTTQIVKYISELDYNQQSAWFSKGLTNIAIDRANEHGSKYKSYHYLLAVDVPDDVEPVDGSIPNESSIHCLVKTGQSLRGSELRPIYRGFNKSFDSSDDMLETFRWTTDDYRAALAYLQVKNENLGWFASTFGFVGDIQLRSDAKELHRLTYDHSIVEKYTDHSDDTVTYTYQSPIYSVSYSNDSEYSYYYFGRKYSVKYLIENDMVRFDSDNAVNERLKEQFRYVCQYGNLAVGNLMFPLELSGDEKISDRIVKHFGKQLVLQYIPPDESDDDDNVYGNVNSSVGYHYANDLLAEENENIYSPINGLCKVTNKSDRGYEFVISTAYNGSNFDYTKKGYVVKISCAKTSALPVGTYTMVRKGDLLGTVAKNVTVNYKKPESTFADKLFPCCTGTGYHYLSSNEFDEPEPEYSHIHIEMYQLPCDFSDTADIEKNVLAPELFFDYSKEKYK